VSTRSELEALHAAALGAVEGRAATRRALHALDLPRLAAHWNLLACGKAAPAMAEGACDVLGERIAAGLATHRDGEAASLGAIEVCTAGHPLPDARSARAGRRALAWAARCRAEDGLLVLLSGGASALWSVPAAGLTLPDKRALGARLLRAGAPIGPLNVVRKHLSRIKGGGLLRAAGAGCVVTVAISDVPDDAPETIGSGPTSADPSTYADALEVLRALALLDATPRAIRTHLELGVAGRIPETLAPGDPALARAVYHVAGSLAHALDAARRSAEPCGWRVRDLGRALDGPVSDVAVRLAEAARRARAEGIDLLVAGGEPSVTVRGPGQGGRAQQLALELGLAIDGEPGIVALVAASDGSDGNTSAAGAFADGATLRRARERSVDVHAALLRSDSHAVHAATGDLFVTGPTRTNVADLALIRLRDPAGLG
jgi:glycerate 2-kinase